MLAPATAETGHTERDGAIVSKRVRDYMRAAGIDWPEDQPPPYWGGAFLAWVAIRQGLTPPPNALDADSWLAWGHPRAAPETGAIAILTGGAGSRVHQIGVVMRVAGDKVYVLHSVNGQVATEAVSADRVIGVRWPPSTPNAQAPVATAGVHEVRLVVDQTTPMQVAAQEPSALMIEHDAGSLDEKLDAALAELRMMRARMAKLESTLETHSHAPVRADGTPIAWDDFVLRSEMQLKSA